MSYLNQVDKYTKRPVPPKAKTIYNRYSGQSAILSQDQINFQQRANTSSIMEYPRNVSYSRIPTMVQCKCGTAGMSQIDYDHGYASKFWCCMLLPFLGTGFCCLCLNSCKDVKHTCRKCNEQVGVNESTLCC